MIKVRLCVKTVAAISESIAGRVIPIPSSFAANSPHRIKTSVLSGIIFPSNRTSRSSLNHACNSFFRFDGDNFSIPLAISYVLFWMVPDTDEVGLMIYYLIIQQLMD